MSHLTNTIKDGNRNPAHLVDSAATVSVKMNENLNVQYMKVMTSFALLEDHLRRCYSEMYAQKTSECFIGGWLVTVIRRLTFRVVISTVACSGSLYKSVWQFTFKDSCRFSLFPLLYPCSTERFSLHYNTYLMLRLMCFFHPAINFQI